MNNLFENKGNLPWTVKTLCNMVAKEKIKFDNYVQRNYVWSKYHKSKLIHSAIIGYPIPPMYASEVNGIYDCLEGKQRAEAFSSYLNDKYALDFETVDMEKEINRIYLEDGTEYDANGKLFSELPLEIQNRITTCSLNLYWYRDMDDDQREEMISRLNGGVAFTAIELTRLEARSYDVILGLANHEIFNVSLTDKAMQKYGNEDIVIKTYATIYMKEPSYTTKDTRSLMRNVEITAEQAAQITAVFDKILAVHRSLINSETKVAKKMLKKTHLLSLTKLASVISESDLRDFVREFYAGTGRSASISEAYNRNCQFGVAKPESVAKRLSEIQKHYDKMKGNAEILEQVTAKIPEIKPHVKSDAEVLKESDEYFKKLDTDDMINEVNKEIESFGLDDISEEVDREDVV